MHFVEEESEVGYVHKGSRSLPPPMKDTCDWLQQCPKYAPIGLPRWPSVYESFGQCRGHGFHPWPEKISPATGQLSTSTTAAEPTCCSLGSAPEKPQQWEAYAPRLESSPHSARLETARMQQQRPSVVKIKIKTFLKICTHLASVQLSNFDF